MPDRARRYGGGSFYLLGGGTCESIGVQTVERIDMHLFELDEPDGDDRVASLVYGDVNVPLICSDAWNCSGQSRWIYASSGAGTVNARAQVRVTTWFQNTGR